MTGEVIDLQDRAIRRGIREFKEETEEAGLNPGGDWNCDECHGNTLIIRWEADEGASDVAGEFGLKITLHCSACGKKPRPLLVGLLGACSGSLEPVGG